MSCHDKRDLGATALAPDRIPVDKVSDSAAGGLGDNFRDLDPGALINDPEPIYVSGEIHRMVFGRDMSKLDKHPLVTDPFPPDRA
jgi:hypothetical protein